MTLQDNGNIGIGAASPQARLDVRGDVNVSGKLNGLFASGGEENLRIIRGTVDLDGTKVFGSGFVSSFSGFDSVPAVYKVTFDRGFAGFPSVTATCHFIDGFSVVVIETNGITPTSAKFRAFKRSNGDDARCQFNFIAVGPR